MTSTLFHNDLEVLRNRTFDEIGIGDRVSIVRTLTASDIQLFAAMSGDVNPTRVAPTMSGAPSRVRVVVEPTNEEWIAGSHALRVLRERAAVDATSLAVGREFFTEHDNVIHAS